MMVQNKLTHLLFCMLLCKPVHYSDLHALHFDRDACCDTNGAYYRALQQGTPLKLASTKNAGGMHQVLLYIR